MRWREYIFDTSFVQYSPGLTDHPSTLSLIPPLLAEAACKCGCGKEMMRGEEETRGILRGKRKYG